MKAIDAGLFSGLALIGYHFYGPMGAGVALILTTIMTTILWAGLQGGSQ